MLTDPQPLDPYAPNPEVLDDLPACSGAFGWHIVQADGRLGSGLVDEVPDDPAVAYRRDTPLTPGTTLSVHGVRPLTGSAHGPAIPHLCRWGMHAATTIATVPRYAFTNALATNTVCFVGLSGIGTLDGEKMVAESRTVLAMWPGPVIYQAFRSYLHQVVLSHLIDFIRFHNTLIRAASVSASSPVRQMLRDDLVLLQSISRWLDHGPGTWNGGADPLVQTTEAGDFAPLSRALVLRMLDRSGTHDHAVEPLFARYSMTGPLAHRHSRMLSVNELVNTTLRLIDRHVFDGFEDLQVMFDRVMQTTDMFYDTGAAVYGEAVQMAEEGWRLWLSATGLWPRVMNDTFGIEIPASRVGEVDPYRRSDTIQWQVERRVGDGRSGYARFSFGVPLWRDPDMHPATSAAWKVPEPSVAYPTIYRPTWDLARTHNAHGDLIRRAERIVGPPRLIDVVVAEHADTTATT